MTVYQKSYKKLKSGRFDAAIIEDTVAKNYLEKMKDLQGVEIKEAPEEVGAAIALPKNSDKTAEFNKVIKKNARKWRNG